MKVIFLSLCIIQIFVLGFMHKLSMIVHIIISKRRVSKDFLLYMMCGFVIVPVVYTDPFVTIDA
jgi:hypothetical protein